MISYLQDVWQWSRPALQRPGLLREVQLPVHSHPLHPQSCGIRHNHTARRQRAAGSSRDHNEQSPDCSAEWKHPGGEEKVCPQIWIH